MEQNAPASKDASGERDRGDVVASRPPEVLDHLAIGRAAERNERRKERERSSLNPPREEESTLAQESPFTKKRLTAQQAREVGQTLGIDWSSFDVEQFRMGMDVELEHGLRHLATNVTDADPVLTGKIALAHLIAVGVGDGDKIVNRMTFLLRHVAKCSTSG
jgi:hypothetical protein